MTVDRSMQRITDKPLPSSRCPEINDTAGGCHSPVCCDVVGTIFLTTWKSRRLFFLALFSLFPLLHPRPTRSLCFPSAPLSSASLSMILETWRDPDPPSPCLLPPQLCRSSVSSLISSCILPVKDRLRPHQIRAGPLPSYTLPPQLSYSPGTPSCRHPCPVPQSNQ